MKAEIQCNLMVLVALCFTEEEKRNQTKGSLRVQVKTLWAIYIIPDMTSLTTELSGPWQIADLLSNDR